MGICSHSIHSCYRTVSINIALEVDLHVLKDGSITNNNGILAGNVICFADFQGICTEFYIGKTVIYRVSLYNHFISRLGSSFRNEL